MHKTIAINKADGQIKRLMNILSNTNVNQLDRSAINVLLQELLDTQKSLNILEFFVNQQEISPEINIHLKLMEEERASVSENKEEIKNETLDFVENKITEGAEDSSDKSSLKQDKSEHHDEAPVVGKANYYNNTEKSKKLEISLNDKFRMINELFNQNQQEYQIAIEQLNAVGTLQESEVYLNSLAELFQWDKDKAAFKILVRIVTKRFI